VGIWLMTTLDETPEFQQEMERSHQQRQSLKTPLLQAVRDYPGPLLVGAGFSVLWAICVYTLIIYTPTYVVQVLHFEARQAFLASFIGNCVMVGSCVYAGALSDRLGRRRVLTAATCLMLVAVYPLLAWLGGHHTGLALIAVQTAFCAMVALFVGVAPATLAGIFPTKVRSSGMSLSYNFSVMIFGGFAPAILTWLTQRPGGAYAPAWYLMAACVVALGAIACLPSEHPSIEPETEPHPAAGLSSRS
jgi:MHS family proline/betaine transporter-like MFS transporter